MVLGLVDGLISLIDDWIGQPENSQSGPGRNWLHPTPLLKYLGREDLVCSDQNQNWTPWTHTVRLQHAARKPRGVRMDQVRTEAGSKGQRGLKTRPEPWMHDGRM